MPYGWEGNRRPGVALAMRRRLVYPPYGLNGLRKRDEHPAYAIIKLGTPYPCSRAVFTGRAVISGVKNVTRVHGPWTLKEDAVPFIFHRR